MVMISPATVIETLLITILLAVGTPAVLTAERDPARARAVAAGAAEVVVTEPMALMGMARLARM
ncbi:hypothetical protein S58_53560 [Bradyrhizobium oligotrophicum S58]|uniref:Uncharacterized protein n=1 Tax=Bradyrhizobium oligotrophicum S58 TaxID=1245469 RepID=M4ZC23_9BRAD|nr:hypothetical protein S58_53560 [Bradyrhizobium oligotrophicum S58]